VALPLARQSVLFGRLARALRAWRLGRITGDTFDSIVARLNRIIEEDRTCLDNV